MIDEEEQNKRDAFDELQDELLEVIFRRHDSFDVIMGVISNLQGILAVAGDYTYEAFEKSTLECLELSKERWPTCRWQHWPAN